MRAVPGSHVGDTVTVVVRHSGSGRMPREVFWENVVDDSFVRDTAGCAISQAQREAPTQPGLTNADHRQNSAH
jgi:hypothetical protein